jgi:hypothetical protein
VERKPTDKIERRDSQWIMIKMVCLLLHPLR